MKKILKKEVIIAFIIGIILASSIAVYAAVSASQITYKDGKTVEYALNDLYSKSNKTPQQVATLTTRGASYTMKNDGYAVGYVHPSYNVAGGLIYLDDVIVFHAVYDEDLDKKASIYVPKGTIIKTRDNYGTYNLTVYEFK